MTSTGPLKIVLVYASDTRSDTDYENQLESAGHDIAGIFAQDDDLTAGVVACGADIVVVRAARPGKALMSKLAAIGDRALCPMILYSLSEDTEIIDQAVRSGANAIAAGSAHDAAFHTLADVAFARFRETVALRRERDAALAKLANRKIVERAKGIIMKERNLGEDDAYRLLRKLAMDRSEPLIQLATKVIEASRLLK